MSHLPNFDTFLRSIAAIILLFSLHSSALMIVAQDRCSIATWDDNTDFSNQQLLYATGRFGPQPATGQWVRNDFTLTLQSTNAEFLLPRAVINTNTRISPDGHLIAGLFPTGDWDVTTTIWDVNGEAIAAFPTHPYTHAVYWLGSDSVLTVVRLIEDSAISDYLYAVHVIADNSTEYIYPPESSIAVATDQPTTPFLLTAIPAVNVDDQLRGVPQFSPSPDGSYIYLGGMPDSPLFDTELQQFLPQDNVPSGVWSADSTKILSLNTITDGTITSVEFLVYDIETHTITDVAEVRVETGDTLTLSEGSWSPDRETVAVGRVNSESYRSVAGIANLATTGIDNLCFELGETQFAAGLGFSFAWSVNSRYVGLYGRLTIDTDNEAGGVYIYDTLENHIYEVYSGYARVIGWMNMPE